MDELLEQFLIESRELIVVAAKDFAALRGDPRHSDALDSAFRAIHTLKGSVALFAMQPAEQVLHAAETVLADARKGDATLAEGRIEALIACLDQIDRWVDELEQDGALGSDAPAIAAEMLARLAPGLPAPAPAAPGRQASSPGAERDDWLARLQLREADVLAQADQPMIAFRYIPDRDCFFRGDDPLAVAGAVPDLVALAILPQGGQWPDAGEIEPFTCFTILEGLSAAPLDKVAAAFQLMPDQVVFAQLDHPAGQRQGPAAERNAQGDRMVRVDVARMDALSDALGNLLIAVNGVAPLAQRAEITDIALASQIRLVQSDLERVTAGLRRTVSAVRSVELAPSLRRLPRLVREIAGSLGKPVDFVIHGQGVEVDKQIADALFEPLLHLLRNALDHGIEAPELRAAAGKPAQGRIVASFHRDGDILVAQLSDDGAGIDIDRIKRVAIERGLLTPEAAEGLSDAGARQLIFAPGFSTATAVTAVSGRGVGMDAVQAAIVALRGTIDIESSCGIGTKVRIRLPISILTTRLLVVEVAGERYGVGLDQIAETTGIGAKNLLPVGDGMACVLHGRIVPVIDLATLLGCSALPRYAAGEGHSSEGGVKLLVTGATGEPVALRVDRFAERIDALVRPRSRMLSAFSAVVGSTLLSDGTILLVLDLAELAA